MSLAGAIQEEALLVGSRTLETLANTPKAGETGIMHSDLQSVGIAARELDNPVWAPITLLEYPSAAQHRQLASRLTSNAGKGESERAKREHCRRNLS